MSAIVLTRIDATKNMRRFYKLDIQPTLFGEWALVREWSRIGRGGAVRSTVFNSPGEAEEARVRQQQKKRRRGYADKIAALHRFLEHPCSNGLPRS